MNENVKIPAPPSGHPYLWKEGWRDGYRAGYEARERKVCHLIEALKLIAGGHPEGNPIILHRIAQQALDRHHETTPADKPIMVEGMQPK